MSNRQFGLNQPEEQRAIVLSGEGIFFSFISLSQGLASGLALALELGSNSNESEHEDRGKSLMLVARDSISNWDCRLSCKFSTNQMERKGTKVSLGRFVSRQMQIRAEQEATRGKRTPVSSFLSAQNSRLEAELHFDSNLCSNWRVRKSDWNPI